MKPDVVEKLRDSRDFYSLAKGVLALCEPFGPVHSFRLVHNRGASSVACFLELESPKQQIALVRSLGMREALGAVCLEIPVRKDFASLGKVLPLAAPGSFESRLSTASASSRTPARSTASR